MTPIEIESYKIKINETKGNVEVGQVMQDLLLEEDIPVDLLLYLIRAIEKQSCIITDYGSPFPDILIKTRSLELLAVARSKQADCGRELSPWLVMRLLSAGFPDPQIEEEAIAMMKKYFRRRGDPYHVWRIGLRDAMKENGGECSLRLLETIAYMLAPELAERTAAFADRKIARSETESETDLEEVAEWDYALDHHFLNGVYEAIDAIRNRLKS